MIKLFREAKHRESLNLLKRNKLSSFNRNRKKNNRNKRDHKKISLNIFPKILAKKKNLKNILS